MTNNGTTTARPGMDWYRILEKTISRYEIAGLHHDVARLAALDSIQLRREIAAHRVRFLDVPAEVVEDADGVPLKVIPATYEETAFTADAIGELEAAWVGDRR